jgi:excisionase family DNA binding protein
MSKKKGEEMPDDLITITEAAELKGVSISTISHAVRRGRITRYEKYGKTLVSRSEVVNYEGVRGWPKGKARKGS